MHYDKELINKKVLPLVTKPITYQGNEVGAVHKDLKDTTIR